jgi:hypothetical protein
LKENAGKPRQPASSGRQMDLLQENGSFHLKACFVCFPSKPYFPETDFSAAPTK